MRGCLPCALILALPVLGSALQRSNIAEMSILAYDYRFNLDRHILSIDWEISGCGEYKLPEYQPQGASGVPTQCGPPKLAVDVYLNDVSNMVLSYDPKKLPVNAIRGPQLTQDLIGFRTEHDLRPSRHSVDFYTFHAFAFAIDPITNLPVNITRFAVAGPLDDFMTDSRGTLTVGAPVYGGNGDSTMAEIETQVFEYRPPKSFWASIMCLLVKSWALALVSACVSLVAVMKGRVNLAGIVPHGFTALVTLGLWKGLFGRQLFGAYLDSMLFYLQTATVAVCSLVLVRIAAKPTHTPPPLEKA